MSVFDFLPVLKEKSVITKLGTLMFLMALCFVVINAVGLIIAIPFFGLDVVLNLDESYDFTDNNSMAFLKYLQFISQLGLFVLPAYLFAFLETRSPSSYFGFNKKISLQTIIFPLLLLISTIPLINFLVTMNEQMILPDFLSGIEEWMRDMEDKAAVATNAFLNVNTLSGLAINLLIVALMAAIGEELLFRGVVLGIFRDSFKNIHLAVILSAILFSAFHAQFYGFIPRMFMGILFGYIFVWTSNIWIPIILHFVFNSVTVVAAYLF